MPEKVNLVNPQMKVIATPQGMLPPKYIRSSINFRALDLMFQKLQMSSKVYKANKIEDKAQLKETFMPKVIKPKQTMTPLQNTKINSSTVSNTTIKIPKMNLFKTTTTISRPNSLPNEDKKKRNYNNIFN